jgi:hypothetical protein
MRIKLDYFSKYLQGKEVVISHKTPPQDSAPAGCGVPVSGDRRLWMAKHVTASGSREQLRCSQHMGGRGVGFLSDAEPGGALECLEPLKWDRRESPEAP